ncbi:oxidation resistance protein 1 isoform X2 [Oncorhynchus mykiss]|uniref:Oxidation resistance protein 1 n=1 Tax=Oncorhynchus mykiss TaxID=8022 RepID=A0A8C7NN22_ONCMY|nr:oxidation resistance protein 1 isoform X2 [Oncorhynchus mykiss]
MFSTKRLKKKSQSVDIATQGFSPTLVPASPHKTEPPVTKTTTLGVQQNNATNSQRICSPRCSELKRGYTIDTGQKKSQEKKDGSRRMSFQRPKGTIEYAVETRDTLNNIALKFDTTPNELVQLNKLFSRAICPGQVLYVPDPEHISSVGSSPSLSPISPLSPTSSDADLEKVTESDGTPRPEAHHHHHAPVFSALRQARVVSSTSEEEEALTEKFLKINCKYITDGKGAVSGVLLVTPNNIMFDPHRMDPLVQEHGCEEYGYMCPLEEVMSAAIYKEITDSKIREAVPAHLEPLTSERGPSTSSQPDPEQRLRVPGNGSGSAAPRSTEGSFSEDVFTESELSPIREEATSSEDPRLDMSSSATASTESIQTVAQVEAFIPPGEAPGAASCACKSVSQPPVEGQGKQPTTAVDNPDSHTAQSQSPMGSKQHSVDVEKAAPSTLTTSQGLGQGPSSRPASQSSTTGPGEPSGQEGSPGDRPKLSREGSRDSETDVEELRKMWKSHTMQQATEQMENVTKKEEGQDSAEVSMERRRYRSHKFLCLRVGQPMKKTFVSNASASMQQYAQRDRKHEYWFAVPQERSEHLYVFFIQWTPDMYGEGVKGIGHEPGFMVVKKPSGFETREDEPLTDINNKEWEVVSLTEYHRRIDALNSEDLKSLCKRLQITTKEEVNSKHATSIKTELEPETFRPNLSEPSELLEAQQIEKLAKNLPPRTIGYPWTLAYGTTKHGMSIKSLYRAMQGQDTPVLLVIRDSDGGVFGALASEPFKISEGFYGTGETFLFTFCPEFKVYKWTGDNMFFMKGDMDSLAFGGGSGEFGLWLDGDLYHGRSHSCKTFGNPMLSKKEDFYIQDIEIWAFE